MPVRCRSLLGGVSAQFAPSACVAKALENIGEAARKVSDETRAAHPEIPWNQIVALRHRIAHDYFRLDLVRIWKIVQEDVPALINQIEPLVPPEEA
ncbi:HepT-like ribonuclease domain-containing protein [Chloroflexus aurantiacus]